MIILKRQELLSRGQNLPTVKGYMNTEEAGRHLGVTPGRIRQYIKKGILPTESRPGQPNWIPEEKVFALKEELLNRPADRRGPKPKVMKQDAALPTHRAASEESGS